MQTINTKIAGVTATNENGRKRQTIIRKLIEPGEILLVEREPHNSFDANAVAIFAVPNDDPWNETEYQIGYLNSRLAADLAPLMDCGHKIVCEVTDVTGGEDGKKTLGVNILLSIFTPEEIAEYNKQKAEENKKQIPNLSQSPVTPTRKETAIRSSPSKTKTASRKTSGWTLFLLVLGGLILMGIFSNGIHEFSDFLLLIIGLGIAGLSGYRIYQNSKKI